MSFLSTRRRNRSSLDELEDGDFEALGEVCRGFEIDSVHYIQWVQRSLNRLQKSGIATDGKAGPQYRNAVQQFQKIRGLNPTGQVDEGTQNKLILANEQDAAYVGWVQRTLNLHGAGLVPDGLKGPRTVKALKDFQRKRVPDLCVDGFVGAKTELRLIQAGGGLPPGHFPSRPPLHHPQLGQGVAIPTSFLGPLEESIQSGELSEEVAQILKWILEPGIIGTDDRARVHNTLQRPFRWICLLVVVFPDPDDPSGSILFGVNGVGSGVLIGGRHILTAGHNLFGDITGSRSGNQRTVPVSAVIAIPGHNALWRSSSFGDPFPFGAYFVRQRDQRPFFSVPDAWKAGQDHRSDFGLVRLNDLVGSKRFPALNDQPLGWWGSSQFGAGSVIASISPEARDALQNRSVYVCGYPGDNLTVLGGSQWLSEGKVRNDLLPSAINPATLEGTQLVGYLADMLEGNSGGPVWTAKRSPGGTSRRLIGVNTLAISRQDLSDTEVNAGVLITPEVVRQIRSWLWSM